VEPKQFLHYQLSDYLGHGPLGDTYEAYDAGLERGVAVKILSPYISESDDLRQRWVIMQDRLRGHADGPAAIFDWAAEGDQQAVIREFIDGESLAVRFRSGRTDYQSALTLLGHLARQIRQIHRADLVHGNLHPSNVIFDHAAGPHLTDPLMPDTVKAWLEALPPARQVFVAPEILQGRTPDRRSDIFALGAIAFYLFLGEELTTPKDLRIEQLAETLAEGSHGGFSALDEIPSEARLFLSMMVAADPHERFADIDSVIATLEQIRTPQREINVIEKKGPNPRLYLILVIGTLLVIVFWIVIAIVQK
jgi:serine/threonine-protein kinase